MIPYSYQMVDMGGIDLAEANGTVVEGLYNRLAIGRNACGDLILYNWKFAGIEITPGICETLDVGTSILINGLIQVTEQDEVNILGIEPPPPPEPVIEPLTVIENGTYAAEDPVSGFSPVTVNVDTFGSEAVAVETKSTSPTGASLQVTYNAYQPIEVLYFDVSEGAYRDFGFIRIMYNVSASQSPDGVAHSGWCIFALSDCASNGVEYSQNQLVKTWSYNATSVSIIYKMEGE